MRLGNFVDNVGRRLKEFFGLLCLAFAVVACGSSAVTDTADEFVDSNFDVDPVSGVVEASDGETTTTINLPIQQMAVLADYEVSQSDGSTYQVIVEAGEVSRFGDWPSLESDFRRCAFDDQRDAYIPIHVEITNTTEGFSVDTTDYFLKFTTLEGPLNSADILNFGDERGCKESVRPNDLIAVAVGFNIEPGRTSTFDGGLVITDVFSPAQPDGDLASLENGILYQFGNMNTNGWFNDVEGQLP